MSRRDYYQVLGIARDAAPGEIHAAYARLVRLHHPDRAGELPTRLADLQAAYRCLADPDARTAHDRMVAEADRAHAERQARVRRRLRGYDRRHPRLLPRAYRNWRRLAFAAIGIAVMAGLSIKLLG